MTNKHKNLKLTFSSVFNYKENNSDKINVKKIGSLNNFNTNNSMNFNLIIKNDEICLTEENTQNNNINNLNDNYNFDNIKVCK